MDAHAIMTAAPVIPVLTIDRIEDAAPLAQALVAGGLRVLEVTLRTDCALDAITAMAEAVPDAIVGAGTILSGQDLEKAVAAGARFAISPGATPAVYEAIKTSSVPFLPGIATASEAMTALEQGVTHVKFFPATAAGGIPALKGIGGPLPQLRFCPTGGIGPGNFRDFLALKNVLCVGGSWVAPAKLIDAGDWAGIEALAKEASGV